MWINSLFETSLLILFTVIIAGVIGTFTAVSAWWSNKLWAYYVPVLTLGVPPWLLSYYISDFGYIDPWLGASISLGVCCSVYPHSIIASSLSNRAHKSWEMIIVARGQNIKSLFMAIWPSLKISLLPSIAIVAAEVVADFGVSNFYGLNTVTMMTYNIWTSTWNMEQIWQGVITLALLGIIISFFTLKSVSSIQSDNTNKQSNLWATLAITPTLLLILFGIYKSIDWISVGGQFHNEEFFTELLNTLYLTLAVVLVCIGTATVYLANIGKEVLQRTGLGFYALPGTVIGATILYLFGAHISLFVLLILAITIRYYGLIINTISVADKGNSKYFEVIDLYNLSRMKRSILKARIVLPSVAIGVCLIILDVIRELPISMILQPMNFQTVAMRMNYIARNENIPMLGPHSLVILFLGIILCLIIVKLIYDTDKKSKL
jgi:iron(III) transport system permease protein